MSARYAPMAPRKHFGMTATDARLWTLDAPVSMLDALRRIRQDLAAEDLDQDQLTFWTLINPDQDRQPSAAHVRAATGVAVEQREVGSTSIPRIEPVTDETFVLYRGLLAHGIYQKVAERE